MNNFTKANLSNIFFQILLFIGFCFALGCSEPSPTIEPPLSKFEDQALRKIADMQDSRNTDDLLLFLSDENPKYRKEAALAFGSVQDSAALPLLYQLLDDESTEVKIAAAYAIGQTKDTTSSSILINAIQSSENTEVIFSELEALGKVITSEDLTFFENFEPTDSLGKSGLAWGIYRASLRGKHSESIISIAADLLNISNSKLTRMGAAQFFGRARNINIKGVLKQLENSLDSDPLAEVRMAVALGLRNLEEQEVIIPILKATIKDPDYRVRINTINALSTDIFELIKEDVVVSLKDENINVGIAAASYLGNTENVQWIYEQGKLQVNWRIRNALLRAAYNLAEGEEELEIESTLIQYFETSENPYEKAWIIRSLSKNISKTDFLASQAFNDTNARVIRSYSIQALGQLRQGDQFSSEMEDQYAKIFQQAMMTGDLVMVFVSSAIFRNPDFEYKKYFQDTDWITAMRNNLDPVEDWEVIQRIDATLAFFNDEELGEDEQAHNPIDWDYFNTFSPNQQVVVKTTKGDIMLEMKLDQAPSSATNFLKLSSEGFYDGINFHRVVPNFVLQGGCPRGDGWGGVDYAISSEIGPARYKTGSVGMASSGKDTEGTQWFITHSPTPHLDGSYSIFAEVISGMEAVNNMEVGDKIISILPEE